MLLKNQEPRGVNASEKSQALKKEALRLEEDTLFTAKGHFVAASRLSLLHYVLRLPTALIAGVSGGTALQKEPAIAGVTAIVAAALASINTFLNPSVRANSHHIAGVKFDSLRNRARIFREIDLCSKIPAESLIERLKKLSAEFHQPNAASQQIPYRAYRRARRGIKEGEADYGIDNSGPSAGG